MSNTQPKIYKCNYCNLWKGTVKEMVFRSDIDFEQHECPRCLTVLFGNNFEQDLDNCIEIHSVEDKTPSAEEYLEKLNFNLDISVIEYFELFEAVESYAQIRVEEARKEWEEEKKQVVKHPLTCNHCGDYFGVNIDHKCFKCLEPLF